MITLDNKLNTGWIFIAFVLTVMSLFQLADIYIFRYQNNWFSQLEFWRILTGHLIHLNWKHLLINSLGLILCMAITSPPWSIKQWFNYHLLLACGISLLFTIETLKLEWYVGYSGILSGIYVLAALDLYKREKIIAVLICAIIGIKIVLEQSGNFVATSNEFIGAPVIVDAHLYGALLALLIARIQQVYHRHYDCSQPEESE